MRPGVRLSIDLGTHRIGVARSDAAGTLAFPLETVYREGGQELFRIVELAAEYDAREIIIGLPRLLSGKEGKNAADVRSWGAELEQLLPTCNIRLVDERLTSVSAHRQLRSAGLGGRQHKNVVDQQAAVLILEQALETERQTGKIPGVPLGSGPESEEA
ncbi:Holliday junction resolvase RuvX [Varibaculum massiliense]|uniref:Holliday junction resolvase RuvX n=1 Tax=Varibaculum massiliense TaxID=1852372 RepID=UPI0008DA3E2F|nr:Holliday junction resolvase RuvX [Varibaculum massiliense]